ncbi:MAG: YjgP/YjgQ family permease [Nitrospira sp.]|nr:YjgP/YjgQ family permease [Nitrospira sp.]
MKILQRHYLKEFFTLLGIIGPGLALIFSMLDLIDKIDDFMPGKPSIFQLILYALFNLPKYLLYLMPMAILIDSLLIFGNASRNKEIVAIKATGGKLKNLFSPFLVCGILFSVMAFLIGEIVVPDLSRAAHELKITLSKKEKKPIFQEGTLWLRGSDGSPVRIELYIPEKKLARGVSIFISSDGILNKRIEAEEAVWEEIQDSRFNPESSSGQSAKGVWKLKKVIVYEIESGKASNVSEIDYPYLESPDFFNEGVKKPEEMGIGELYKYTKRLNDAGFRNTKLIVDLNSRTSYPLTNFFMILLGIALSLRSQFGGGLFAAGLGLLISLIYWLGHTLMLSMGYAGIIPPLVSAWIMPFVFGVVAMYLFIKIPE